MARTFVSASELRRGLEAERVIPRPGSVGLTGSWMDSDSPAEPRVTELPAFLKDVLQDPGASVAAGLLGSCYTASKTPQVYCLALLTDFSCSSHHFCINYLFNLIGDSIG